MANSTVPHSTNAQSPQSPLEDAVEEVQLKVCVLRTPESPSSGGGSCRRRSSERLSSTLPPAVLIHGWLLSFSHYIALYSMLVARLGTRCDCRKLRAKSEVVRRRSVDYARKCQDGILPIVLKTGLAVQGGPSSTILNRKPPISRWFSRRGSRRSNLEDYYRLFFLHCSCLEFFLEQLLRTAQLFQCFSLNVGRSLTSSLVAPPENFIYSGLADVERPRRKRSQLLPHRNRDEGNTFVNDSLSGIELELASKTSFGQTQSGELENRSSETTHTPHNPMGEQNPAYPGSSIIKLKRLFSPTVHESLQSPTKTIGSPVKSSYLSTGPIETKKKFTPPVQLSHNENKKRVRESDAECFEKLIEDIRIIKDMIMEIHMNVSVNPWATRLSRRRRKHQPNNIQALGNLEVNNCEEDSYFEDEEFEEDDEEEENWPQEDCGFVHRNDLRDFSDNRAARTQYRHHNSRLSRWKRRFRNACLTRVMRRSGSPSGFEEKAPEDDETILSKRLRRKQYICLSLIIVFSIGLFGSALGSCIYLLA